MPTFAPNGKFLDEKKASETSIRSKERGYLLITRSSRTPLTLIVDAQCSLSCPTYTSNAPLETSFLQSARTSSALFLWLSASLPSLLRQYSSLAANEAQRPKRSAPSTLSDASMNTMSLELESAVASFIFSRIRTCSFSFRAKHMTALDLYVCLSLMILLTVGLKSSTHANFTS